MTKPHGPLGGVCTGTSIINVNMTRFFTIFCNVISDLG